MSEDNNQLLERVIDHVFENYDTDNCSDELLERIVDAVMEKMVKEDEVADFDNALMRLGNDISEWSRDKMPIWKLNPNQSFDLDDFGWWMSGGVSVASTISMMIPGIGVVKGAS